MAETGGNELEAVSRAASGGFPTCLIICKHSGHGCVAVGHTVQADIPIPPWCALQAHRDAHHSMLALPELAPPFSPPHTRARMCTRPQNTHTHRTRAHTYARAYTHIYAHPHMCR